VIGEAELTRHLTEHRIAGYVATPREHNLRNYARLARRDPDVLFGLDPEGEWDRAAVLALMAARCGVSADAGRLAGPDTIDPGLTVRGLDALAQALAETAARRGAVMFGTGHPSHLTAFYAALADGARAAGCAVLTPAHGRDFLMHGPEGARPSLLDYVRQVGVVRVYEENRSNGGGPSEGAGSGAPPPAVHTHSAQPVRAALAALAEDGGPRPELVVGDHGWACGAGRLGLRTIGLADSNDPAVFVAEAEGQVEAAIPLDDGVRSDCYGLLSAYVLQLAGMSR
jgi:hypothetical protein